MSALTEGQRGLIALDWCQKEIRNGGIPQLFANSTGDLVPWAIEGFRMIQGEKYASILAEAAALLGPDYPTSGPTREEAYRRLSKADRHKITRLEASFFALLHSTEDDLEQYHGQYVKSHPTQFVRVEADG